MPYACLRMMEKTAKDDKVLKMIRVVGDRQFTQSRNTGQRVGQLMTKDLRIAIKLIDNKLHINP